MQKPFFIGNRPIGVEHPPFLIAEMSGNHNQSLDRALAIVDAAAKAGADAIKLQTYTADTMTLDLAEREFLISDPGSLWAGKSLHRLYDEAHTPWQWHKPIFERCREHGMLAFSTPFDHSAVQFLESLEVPAYKIASFENTDLDLIRLVAATGKPLIISIGMASVAEIDEAVQTARAAGCSQLALLKCTSAYPAPPSECNLQSIPFLRGMFGTEVGLSDHTLGVGVAVGSVALGASIIEKHFTLSRAEGGVDSAFSLEPAEFRQLADESRQVWQALGHVSFGISAKEQPSLRFRRSLYIVSDLEPGAELTRENLRAIRPGFGLAPKHLDSLIGRRVTRQIKRGTAMSWDLL